MYVSFGKRRFRGAMIRRRKFLQNFLLMKQLRFIYANRNLKYPIDTVHCVTLMGSAANTTNYQNQNLRLDLSAVSAIKSSYFLWF